MKNFGIATGAFVSDRDDWPAAIGKATSQGWRFLELTAIDEERFDTLATFLEASPGALEPFARVSIHAPVHVRTSATSMVERLAAWTSASDVVFHPDVYRQQPLIGELGPRALFENMDVAKQFGRNVEDLGDVFERYPEAGLCLDVAHVWTNDPSLRLADELLDRFGDRLSQLHVSGIERDGTHRPTTEADLELYEPVLRRCPSVPWLLETELVSSAPARPPRSWSASQSRTAERR